jgi:hypothetical protein
VHHVHQCEQRCGGEGDLFVNPEVCGFGLQHPQRDLQRMAIRALNGHRTMGFAGPGDYLEAVVM